MAFLSQPIRVRKDDKYFKMVIFKKLFYTPKTKKKIEELCFSKNRT